MEYPVLNPWKVLGIAPTTNRKAVKRAYAALLKQTRPDTDAEAYQQLREAFDIAVSQCKRASATQDDITPPQTPEPKALLESPLLPRQTPTEAEPQEPVAEVEKPIGAEDETSKPDTRQQLEQNAYSQAQAAAQRVFNCESEDRCIAVFEQEIHSNTLLNIKTRAYFEIACLSSLARSSEYAMPYGLVKVAAKEFHWFNQQHSNPEKAHRVAYLEQRLCTYQTYLNSVLLTAQSGAAPEKGAARLIAGEYRPFYFHFVRFIGNYNRTVRKYTRNFSRAVDEGMCPEMDIPSFHWWQQKMERSLYSAWHFVAGFVVFIFSAGPLSTHLPLIPNKYTFWAGLIAVAIFSLGVWAVDALYQKTQHWFLDHWLRFRSLSGSEFILSSIYIGSVFIWRQNSDTAYIGWLLPLAFLACTLLFGLKGLLKVLLASFVYFLCYAVMDPLKAHPSASSMALIIGFISLKIFFWVLHSLPNSLKSVVSKHPTLYWLIAGFTACTLSFGYLKLVLM